MSETCEVDKEEEGGYPAHAPPLDPPALSRCLVLFGRTKLVRDRVVPPVQSRGPAHPGLTSPKVTATTLPP